jgi:hypothetical protein
MGIAYACMYVSLNYSRALTDKFRSIPINKNRYADDLQRIIKSYLSIIKLSGYIFILSIRFYYKRKYLKLYI